MKKLLTILVLVITLFSCEVRVDEIQQAKLNSKYVVWSEDSRWLEYYCDSFKIEQNCIKFKGFNNGIICGKFSIVEMKSDMHNK